MFIDRAKNRTRALRQECHVENPIERFVSTRDMTLLTECDTVVLL